MGSKRFPLPSVIAGLYAWLATLFLGATYLDVRYSRLLDGLLAPGSAPFAAIADLLLVAGFFLFLAALAALALSWNVARVRNLLLTSLLILSSQFLAPLLLTPVAGAIEQLHFGPVLRLLPTALASLLALAAAMLAMVAARPS
jgi:hypothetical protein